VLRLGFSTKGAGLTETDLTGKGTHEIGGTAPGRSIGGRGLGLALVRQAVTRLGGTLTIGRREGAVFTVTIPARIRSAVTTAGGQS
jgi:signal transduction histidine kinase